MRHVYQSRAIPNPLRTVASDASACVCSLLQLVQNNRANFRIADVPPPPSNFGSGPKPEDIGYPDSGVGKPSIEHLGAADRRPVASLHCGHNRTTISYLSKQDLDMRADAIVKARIPASVKDRAMDALEDMGLSASDLIRLTFLRVAEEGRLPFDVAVPNRTTRKAIEELKKGKGKRFASKDALFKDLGL
jgi:DNA-damage-inducible protein J